MKVVINSCYGGFGLSKDAILWLAERGNKLAIEELKEGNNGFGIYGYDFSNDEMRNNEDLIHVVEFLGDDVNSNYSKLKIVEIPDDVEWTIEEYDGNEWVAEKHRTWS